MVDSKKSNHTTTISDYFLTVIIPVRHTNKRSDFFDRLKHCLSDHKKPKNVELLVIDDGTADEKAKQLKEECSHLDITYRSTNKTQHLPFNLSRARNAGAMHASGDLILFMDIDFMPYDGFYNDIINEARLLNLDTCINQFIMCPIIHFTSKGGDEISQLSNDLKRQFAINAMISADDQLIEKYSHGTSAILTHRHYYLSMGGHNESFEQWGYEDYEFTTRLMMKNPAFPIPKNWSSMAGNFMTINSYRGWKAAYRLHGDWLGSKGIYLFHIHHPIDSKFHSNKGRNQRLLEKQLKRQNNAIDPEPLPYPNAGKSLLFSKNPFCYHQTFAPFWGESIFKHSDDFPSQSSLTAFIAKNNISRVIFPNPYNSSHLTKIYQWCKALGFPIIVAERGALPDSVYHDNSGFLTDSNNYDEEKWNKPLKSDQKKSVKDYIKNLRISSSMLEYQPKRNKKDEILKRLNIDGNKKIIFVPFQQPNDSVIQFFCGKIQSFDNFHHLICTLTERLGNDGHIIYKKHPVEDMLQPIPGAICADDFNTYDLIEIADALVVINSGVGLYGSIFEKPVFILGDAWYQHQGINFTVDNIDQLELMVKQYNAIDTEKMERFIYYLRFEFYSFGKQQQRRIMVNKKPINTTTDIKYYEVRFHGRTFSFNNNQLISTDSPLFDRYRGNTITTTQQKLSSNSAAKKLKLRKLKNHPVKFFIDALKNKIRLFYK